ncbi:hypothetical protein F4801DRAFT_578903 [Xylaria longipes]|nr:hypothetical protein F4801DRAFT_578903 [Xylaria longipes]RYC61889.1 hypothetical protein CHU98_g4335 [Xylaria longipes]
MMFLNAIVVALFWVITPVQCLPDPTGLHHGTFNAQATANLTWEGSLTEDGPNVTFTGRSIAEISSHIKMVAPSFAWPGPIVQSRSARPLVKNSEHRMLCDQVTSDYANYYDVLDQTAQLQAMPGFCRVAPTLKDQPLSCNRLTCTGSSAVYLCNHSDNHDSISTCARVGQYAQEILDWCYYGDDSNKQNVKGQIYDGDYWSVMVHADKC